MAYLRSLPTLWTDSGPKGRQRSPGVVRQARSGGLPEDEILIAPDAIELGLSAALPAILEYGGQMGGAWSSAVAS